MTPKHYLDYSYFNFAAYSAGKTTLYSPKAESILYNKLLQYVKFGENHVQYQKNNLQSLPFPKTGAAFSVKEFKNNLQKFPKQSIIKEVIGYEGTGVKLSYNERQSTELFCKSVWSGEQSIIQNFIDDSIGRSIRVLVIGGKAISFTEFQDDGDFKSNNYSEYFKVKSKMNSQKKNEYQEMAERACAAIDQNLTIGGVDIMDSKKYGLVVLEINQWPEITLSEEATGLPLLEYFVKEFIQKIQCSQIDCIKSN